MHHLHHLHHLKTSQGSKQTGLERLGQSDADVLWRGAWEPHRQVADHHGKRKLGSGIPADSRGGGRVLGSSSTRMPNLGKLSCHFVVKMSAEKFNNNQQPVRPGKRTVIPYNLQNVGRNGKTRFFHFLKFQD